VGGYAGPQRRLDLFELEAALANGCSIKINHAERFCSSVRRFIWDLENWCGYPASDAAIFFSPPFGRALPIHRDEEHVFTVQLAGVKIWSIYSGSDPTEAAKAPSDQVRVKPGEVLYLPRNVDHSA